MNARCFPSFIAPVAAGELGRSAAEVCLHGERYETIIGSDGARDGMFLELWDRPSNELALWAFFSDADGSFEFTRYRADVPAEVEAWFQAEARRRLPPVADAEPGAAADPAGM